MTQPAAGPMYPEQYRILYDVEAEHPWYRGMRHIAFGLIDRFLPPGRTYTVLDCGCGTGGTTVEMRRFGRVVGVEASALGVQLASRRGLPLVQGSADRLPFTAGSFDLITAFDVLCILDDVTIALALSEFRRVLKPGGICFIRDPALEWLRGSRDAAVAITRRRTVAELRGLLQAAGFQVEFGSYADAVALPIVVLKRTLERLYPKAASWFPDELTLPPAILGSLFYGALALESIILRWRPIPVGVSAVVVGRAPRETTVNPSSP